MTQRFIGTLVRQLEEGGVLKIVFPTSEWWNHWWIVGSTREEAVDGVCGGALIK